MYSLVMMLLLVFSVINAFPMSCNVDLPVAQEDEIYGKYVANGWMISFHTLLRDGMVRATTTFENTTVSSEMEKQFQFMTKLTFEDPGGRVIPGIEKAVMEEALEVVESTKCNIPFNIIDLYEEMASNLFECTKDLKHIQIRYSVMYFVSVVGSAQRICDEEENVCSASPKYVYSESMFICQEDLMYLYDHIPVEEKQIHVVKRGLFCPWIHGSETCCCGNYDFTCLYCSAACCVHDLLCRCCRPAWFCLPGCKPERGCRGGNGQPGPP